MRAQQDLRRRSRSIAPTNIVVALLGVLGGGRAAHAQSADAEALFNQGDKLMTEGKLAQACDAFEGSNRAEPRAGTLIRLGDCREQNQQLASAWSAYNDALARVKDPRKRELATARIAALAARLSYLTVEVSSDARADGLTISRNGQVVDPALWNRAQPVDGGDYVILARAPGRADWRSTARVATSGAKVRIEVPRLDEPTGLTSPTAQPVATAGAGEAGRSSALLTSRRKLAIGVAGASVVSIVVGGILGNAANGKHDDAFRLCPEPAKPCDDAPQARALIQVAQRRALEANVAFGIAAASAVAAGVLWFTGAPDTESMRVAVVPGASPSETRVVVMGRF